jgi:mannan endo-1,4-beta-mannosidase
VLRNGMLRPRDLAVAAILCGALAVGASAAEPQGRRGFEHFITRRNHQLMDGDQVFRFIGMASSDLGAAAVGSYSQKIPGTEYELRDAFESMRQMGQAAVRVYCFLVLADQPQFGHLGKHIIGPRKYNEEAFRATDKMIQLAEEYNVRLIIPFIDQHNFGASHRVFARIHGKQDFYRHAREEFKQFITDLMARRNHFTGRLYRDEKAVLAWQLGNELSPPPDWESEIAAHLEKVAPNHLVASALHLREVAANQSALQKLHRNLIRDPNLDIIDYHLYPGPPNDIRTYEDVARKGKVVIFGEFGGRGGAATVKPFFDKFLASDIAGANYWALLHRARFGGFLRFQREFGATGFSRLHWPYWDNKIEAVHDVPEVLALLQDAAFKLQGKPVPEHRVPVPKAPELLPIDDPLAISWRGPTGARWYKVQHAMHAEGPWATVGKNVRDHVSLLWFGSIFEHKDAPEGKGFYRVRAANEAGISPWSNVVEVGAPHPIMTEMYLEPNLLRNWSFEEGAAAWAGLDGNAVKRTETQRFSGAVSAEFTTAQPRTLSQTVVVKPRTDYIWVFHCRVPDAKRVVGRVLAKGSELAREVGRPVRRGALTWAMFSLHFNSREQESVTLSVTGTGPNIFVDDMVLVENPQWVQPRLAQNAKPTYGWRSAEADARWSNPENWAPKGVPGPGDTVHHRRKNIVENLVVDQDVTIAHAKVHWDHVRTVQGDFYRANWVGDKAGRTLTITDSLRIMNAGRSDGQVWTGGSVSELNLKDLHLRIGTPKRPAEVVIALDQSPSAQSPRTARLTVKGGSVTAHLSSLGIGRDLGSLHGPTGILDLGKCKKVAIRVTGDVDLGHMTTWEGNYHSGLFHCGGGSVHVGGNLRLADARGDRWGDGSRGRLFLVNTRFTVAQQAIFNGKQTAADFNRRYAQVFAVVDGQPCGLDLTRKLGNALSFTFGKANDATATDLNQIRIRFTKASPTPDADGWYWGLRWAGDHVALLRGYLSEAHPRLHLDITELPREARGAHLAYLARQNPENYASKKPNDLAPDDFVVYDPVNQKTYIGVRLGTGHTRDEQ